MNAQKPEWFEYSESNTPASGIRKIDKKLPLGIIASVGAILIAGSIFATTSDESSANASPTVAATAQPSSSAPSADAAPSTSSAPRIAAQPKNRFEDGDDDGREGRHHDEERFEGGEH